MSISDRIVVMKEGVVQQMGKPQEVYDDPANLFVAKFLGTPQINVFHGEIKDRTLYIGGDAVLPVRGEGGNRKVYVGVRPEGFVPRAEGPLLGELKGVEVMGRDISVVFTHKAALDPSVRAIVSTEHRVDAGSRTAGFALLPHKAYVFDRETEERIYLETGAFEA